MKFSDIYIETKIKQIINNNNLIEYEERNIIKELIPINKDLYYLWRNIGTSILLDYKCNSNNKIKKVKELCFDIETKIKRGDFDIVILDIKNVLLPYLDKLTDDEIKIIYKAHRESSGPLYDVHPNYNRMFITPQIFIDLFNWVMCNYK